MQPSASAEGWRIKRGLVRGWRASTEAVNHQPASDERQAKEDSDGKSAQKEADQNRD